MINFKFDKKIKKGFYTASYFLKTKHIVSKYKPNEEVCMQFTHFSKNPVKICGIQEIVELIKFSLTPNEIKNIKIYGVKDGEIVLPKKPILLITGKYQYFAIFENIIDGILARRSSVCNNCDLMLKVIKPEQLIYMADRTDDYLIQPYDGYSAYVAGVRNFVTEASISLIDNKKDIKVTGTIPHSLIQEFDGNLNDVLSAYAKEFGNTNLIALIDYHNDIKKEIKLIAKNFPNLWAVRVDTSKNICDVSLPNKKNNYGVSDNLIKLTRKILDENNLKKTKIIISSALDVNRVKEIVRKKLPVDLYGVGSSLINRNIHITGDLVLKNGIHQAKTGRKLFININKIKYLKNYI